MTWARLPSATDAVTTPSFPASGTPVTNSTGRSVTVYLTAGLAAITAVAINAVTVTGLTIGAGVLGPPIRLGAGASITLTYTGAPGWQWVA
jgi:hypothetical protein